MLLLHPALLFCAFAFLTLALVRPSGKDVLVVWTVPLTALRCEGLSSWASVLEGTQNGDEMH